MPRKAISGISSRRRSFTGCRYSELGRLRAGDFNPESGTVFVGQSKSGKARHVVLTDEGRRFFETLTAGRPGDALMLTHADGLAWGPSHQIRPMAEACRAARIKPAAGFHILRHTSASHLVMSGVPLNVVAHNLGHADTRMTERHYCAPCAILCRRNDSQVRAGLRDGWMKPTLFRSGRK